MSHKFATIVTFNVKSRYFNVTVRSRLDKVVLRMFNLAKIGMREQNLEEFWKRCMKIVYDKIKKLAESKFSDYSTEIL